MSKVLLIEDDKTMLDLLELLNAENLDKCIGLQLPAPDLNEKIGTTGKHLRMVMRFEQVQSVLEEPRTVIGEGGGDVP